MTAAPALPPLQIPLVRGKQKKSRRVLLFAPEGIGKSTFASQSEAPVFICAEDGTSELDVARWPNVTTWADVLAAVKALTETSHEFKTLVIDTLDWVEPMLWAFICGRDKKKDIEAYGYGKGYTAALAEWQVLVRELERLRRERGMDVILLAHSWIKAFKDPESDGYDRYELKLHAKAAGLLKEWCDAVLFANYETLAYKDERTERVRGVSSGARIIHTERHAAFDAKNRYGLPSTLPLSWADFDAACRAGKDPAELVAAIKATVEQLDAAEKKTALEYLEKAGNDVTKLAQVKNWANAKAAEKAGKAS